MTSYLRVVPSYYKRYQDRFERIWYVRTDTPFAADDIWMHNPLNQKGLGGATKRFDLGSGSSIEVKGPWHSNASDFLYACGIDLREKHAIKLKVTRIVGGEVMYQDHDWVAGSTESSRECAQHIADHNYIRVKAEVATASGVITYLLGPDVKPNEPVA